MTSRHLAGARAKRGYPLRGLLSRTGRCPVRSIGAARSRLPTARPLRGSDCGTRLDLRPFGLTPAGHEAGSRALLGARGFAPLKLTAAWARPALGRRTHASCPAPRFRLPPAPARGAGGAAGACPGPRFAAPVALDIGVADERFFSPRGRSTRSPADCTEATPRVARLCLLIYGKVAADLVRKPRATGTGEEGLPNSRCAACGGAGPVDFAGKRARFVVSLRGQFTVQTDGGCGGKENAEASSLRGRSRQLDERLTSATGADPLHFVLFKSTRR